MDIQELAASILADARRDAARIDADTQAQVDAIEGRTQALLRERREHAIAQAQARYASAMRREQARVERDARLAVLACKRELLDQAFAQASAQLIALRGPSRRAIIDRLLERARREVPDLGEIAPAAADAAYVRSKAARWGIPVRGTAPSSNGGIIARSRDDRVRIDLRFETILAQVRQERASEIARELFLKPAQERSATVRVKAAGGRRRA